jgi:hypothetical protein
VASAAVAELAAQLGFGQQFVVQRLQVGDAPRPLSDGGQPQQGLPFGRRAGGRAGTPAAL